jgi:general secretion pathway protein D
MRRFTMKSALLAGAACCLLTAALAAAAESAPAASTTPSESGVPLERLIAGVAKRTGKTFVVDPRVRAEVIIIGRPPGDLTYAELLGVLDVYGFAAIEDTGFVRVVPNTAVRTEAIPTITAKDTRPASEYVTEIVAVKNVSAPQLVPILRPLLPQVASLVALPETNSLVIVDRFASLRRIEGLIRTLDSMPLNKGPGSAPAGGSAGTQH